jgi:hypothetical protein
MIDSDLLKDFEWYRNKKGYRLSVDPPFKSLGEQKGQRAIVSNGRDSELISHRPFARGGDLCTVFAAIKTAGELLRFVNLHGPLTAHSLPSSSQNAELLAKMRKLLSSGESVDAGLENAKMFGDLLRLKSQGNTRRLASYFESGKPAFFRVRDLIGRVELVGDPTRGLRLKMCPPHLLGALWYQLGLKLSQVTLRTCPVCDKVFEVGAGTGLRADATFCCREHKVKFFNQKRPRLIQHSKQKRQ